MCAIRKTYEIHTIYLIVSLITCNDGIYLRFLRLVPLYYVLIDDIIFYCFTLIFDFIITFKKYIITLFIFIMLIIEIYFLKTMLMPLLLIDYIINIYIFFFILINLP